MCLNKSTIDKQILDIKKQDRNDHDYNQNKNSFVNENFNTPIQSNKSKTFKYNIKITTSVIKVFSFKEIQDIFFIPDEKIIIKTFLKSNSNDNINAIINSPNDENVRNNLQEFDSVLYGCINVINSLAHYLEHEFNESQPKNNFNFLKFKKIIYFYLLILQRSSSCLTDILSKIIPNIDYIRQYGLLIGKLLPKVLIKLNNIKFGLIKLIFNYNCNVFYDLQVAKPFLHYYNENRRNYNVLLNSLFSTEMIRYSSSTLQNQIEKKTIEIKNLIGFNFLPLIAIGFVFNEDLSVKETSSNFWFTFNTKGSDDTNDESFFSCIKICADNIVKSTNNISKYYNGTRIKLVLITTLADCFVAN